MTRAEDPSPVRQGAPREDYARHLESRRAALIRASRQHLTFGNLRVAALALGLAAAYAALALGWFSAWWLVAFLAGFLWVGQRLESAVNASRRLGRPYGDGRFRRAAIEVQ